MNTILLTETCVFEQDSPDLMLLLRMLSLGQGAWDMIDSQVFKEPRLVCALLKRQINTVDQYWVGEALLPNWALVLVLSG